MLGLVVMAMAEYRVATSSKVVVNVVTALECLNNEKPFQ